jgi:NAD(P)-dependent dehydrogenase (short-subunit alcohol dehydrogenase family)
MIDLDLEGKRAVVTVASLGIGAASVRLLADHGADVLFCARNANAVQ